jgi:multidrug efflux pump subunit AcrA (membrane-fusion protein)
LQIVAAAAIVAAGMGVAQYLIATRPKPEGNPAAVRPRLVRVMEAARASHRCSASAFGTASASRQWAAIAQTNGDAIFVEPEFEPGEILSQGTLLVQIDPEDYQLAQRRYEAEARARDAQLKELQETEKNLLEIRQLQKEQLDLAQKDLVRMEGLLGGGAATEASADAARTLHLTRLLAFQETSNSLSLIPVLRARAEAERDAANVHVDQARREIEKCAIRLPFDGRCVTKSVEPDQYVNAGQRLGVFLSLDSAEVVAMVDSGKGGALFPRGIPGLGSLDLRESLANLKPVREALRLLDAEVHWGTPPRRGKVTRIGSTADPATRTFPVIIEVADPYKDVTPGLRPPLVPDVFCEVTLYGATVDDVVVIPRDCIHEMPRKSLSDEFVPVVYLLRGGTRREQDGETCFEDGQLEIREVAILVEENDVVVLDSGVEEGDLIVLGDLYVPREHWGAKEFGPASEAMPLRGVLATPPKLHREGPPRPLPGGPSPAGDGAAEVAR